MRSHIDDERTACGVNGTCSKAIVSGIMDHQCICQICTCGRHRCPHNQSSLKPMSSDTPCVLTEYDHAFQRWPYQAQRESLRPPLRPHTSSHPMDITTTYETAYVPHGFEKRAVLKRNKDNMHLPTNVKMNLLSTYDNDFKGEGCKRVGSFKPENKYAGKQTPFTSRTIYQMSYKQFAKDDLNRSLPIKHKECIELTKDKFEGCSTQQGDYKHHQHCERATLIKPKQERSGPLGKFNGSTTYRKDFSAKKPQTPPAKLRAHLEYKKPDKPFRGTTTVKADYQAPTDHQRMPSYKPELTYQPSKTPFEGETTASTAYRSWPVQRLEEPVWAKQKGYEPPTQEFHKKSFYKETFVAPPRDYKRVGLAKPGRNEFSLAGSDEKSKFTAVTHYQENYVDINDRERQKSFKVVQVYQSPKEALQGESTYTYCYKGEPSERSAICRPHVAKIDTTKAAMCSDTIYRDTYKGQQLSSCPATDLVISADEAKAENTKTSAPVYEFQQEKNGHKFYRASLEGDTK